MERYGHGVVVVGHLHHHGFGGAGIGGLGVDAVVFHYHRTRGACAGTARDLIDGRRHRAYAHDALVDAVAEQARGQLCGH